MSNTYVSLCDNVILNSIYYLKDFAHVSSLTNLCIYIYIYIYIYIHTYSLQNPLLFWLPVPCLKCIYNAFTDFVPNDRSTFGSPWHCGFCGACAPWNFQTHAPPFVPYACNCSDVRRWACSASCILSSWRVIQVASTSWAVPQSLKVPLAANATMPLWSAFVLRISQRFVPARMSQSHSGFTVRIFHGCADIRMRGGRLESLYHISELPWLPWLRVHMFCWLLALAHPMLASLFGYKWFASALFGESMAASRMRTEEDVCMPMALLCIEMWGTLPMARFDVGQASGLDCLYTQGEANNRNYSSALGLMSLVFH